jgi:hypothetical protein
MVQRATGWDTGSPKVRSRFLPTMVVSEVVAPSSPCIHEFMHVTPLVPRIFDLQMKADGLQGYDYVAYHGYGKRRYFELVDRK